MCIVHECVCVCVHTNYALCVHVVGQQTLFNQPMHCLLTTESKVVLDLIHSHLQTVSGIRYQVFLFNLGNL